MLLTYSMFILTQLKDTETSLHLILFQHNNLLYKQLCTY